MYKLRLLLVRLVLLFLRSEKYIRDT